MVPDSVSISFLKIRTICQMCFSYKRLITGILYLFPISANRWTMGHPLRNAPKYRQLCGDHWLRNVVLVTTMWDQVPSGDEGPERERELKFEHWKMMLDQGSVVTRYSGTQESAWDVVDQFFRNARAEDGRKQLLPMSVI